MSLRLHFSSPTQRQTDAGYTLLEMLIAVLVISFGLLGLAGLQATALKNNHSAYMNAVATQLAYEMADRIRANKGIAYDTVSPPAAVPDCESAACSPATLAQYDVAQWRTKVSVELAGASIPSIALANGVYTLTLTWTDKRDGALTTTYSTSFVP